MQCDAEKTEQIKSLPRTCKVMMAIKIMGLLQSTPGNEVDAKGLHAMFCSSGR